MKETVNANIGSIAFTIDRDAYQALEHYFREIRRRLPDDDTETMGDIESRVAEILVEKVPSPTGFSQSRAEAHRQIHHPAPDDRD